RGVMAAIATLSSMLATASLAVRLPNLTILPHGAAKNHAAAAAASLARIFERRSGSVRVRPTRAGAKPIRSNIGGQQGTPLLPGASGAPEGGPAAPRDPPLAAPSAHRS